MAINSCSFVGFVQLFPLLSFVSQYYFILDTLCIMTRHHVQQKSYRKLKSDFWGIKEKLIKMERYWKFWWFYLSSLLKELFMYDLHGKKVICRKIEAYFQRCRELTVNICAEFERNKKKIVEIVNRITFEELFGKKNWSK